MENEELRTGYVYVIRNDMDNEEYYGSTFQSLSKRMSCHKKFAELKYDRKLYKKINEIGFKHFRIILVETVQVKNQLELRREEDKYIVERKPVLNMRNAVMNVEKKKKTKHDLYEKKKDQIQEYNKIYHETNKDRRHAKTKVKYDCECGKRLRIGDKASHEKTIKHQEFINKNI